MVSTAPTTSVKNGLTLTNRQTKIEIKFVVKEIHSLPLKKTNTMYTLEKSKYNKDLPTLQKIKK